MRCILIQITEIFVTEILFEWKQLSMDSGNGLVANRQQAITWTHVQFADAYMRHKHQWVYE